MKGGAHHMNSLTLPSPLPPLPPRVTVRLAQLIAEEVERELFGAAAVRRELQDVARSPLDPPLPRD
jgi:hypothetical protein